MYHSRPISAWLHPGAFTFQLDDNRMPNRVSIAENISDRIESIEYSEAALTGYYLALWDKDGPAIAAGNLRELSSRPKRRAYLTTMLGAKDAVEFDLLERAATGEAVFSAHGPLTERGDPTVILTANLRQIESITIDPTWAAQASSHYLAADILDCSEQIKRIRPTFRVDHGWDARSESELEIELDEFRSYLNRNFR